MWIDLVMVGLIALEAAILGSFGILADVASSLIIGLFAGLGVLWSDDDSTIPWRWAIPLGFVAGFSMGAFVAIKADVSFGSGAIASVVVALIFVGIAVATKPSFQRGLRASAACG